MGSTNSTHYIWGVWCGQATTGSVQAAVGVWPHPVVGAAELHTVKQSRGARVKWGFFDQSPALVRALGAFGWQRRMESALSVTHGARGAAYP